MTRPRLFERTARTGLLLCVLLTLGGGIVVAAAYLGAAMREGEEWTEVSLRPFGFSEASGESGDASADGGGEAVGAGIDVRAARRSDLPRDQQLFRDWVDDHMEGIDNVRLVSMQEVRSSEPRRVRVRFNCESILGGRMSRDWVFEQQKSGFVKLH
ncbi:MAG: hypothetical protein AAGJ46_18475 [Planctomycetota bacterium]